jgi:hypothetical protein
VARQYTANMANVTVTSTNTWVALSCPSPSPAIEVLRAWASQHANATSAQQEIRLVTQFNQATANQVVGAAATLGVVISNDPATKLSASTVCGAGAATVNCTSDGNGAKSVLYPDNFNVLNGWLWVPTPNETHILSALASSVSYGLFAASTPGTTSNWSAGLSYHELG